MMYNGFMKEKQIRTLERVFKGVGNHYRIEILLLIEKKSKISLEDIVSKIKSNYFTIAEHVNRLKYAGLITKRYKGRNVIHELSPFGIKMIKVLKTFLD